MNTVSSASITGMVVSLILCVAAPVALCILLKRKTAAKLSDMFLGVVIFILFARFLEQLLHMAMLSAFGEKLTGNLWLSALYGGAAAAVFEEFGRLIAMKYLLDNQLEKENALMYGVGHGGIEALTIGALTCVSNLATVSMIYGGKLESALAGLDEAARATTMATVSQLWTLPSYLFYMVGVERLIAFALQICLSYLVYRAVRYHRRGFFLAAVGILRRGRPGRAAQGRRSHPRSGGHSGGHRHRDRDLHRPAVPGGIGERRQRLASSISSPARGSPTGGHSFPENRK